ncbi:MAG: APC family permease [Acidimicrobiales bacterium]
MVDEAERTGLETPRGDTDSSDLAQFGYHQQLRRRLGQFSSFASSFSYISPSTGIFTLFALGLGTIGGIFIWSWPMVGIGQLIVAIGFAELASQYPVAGSVFQWTKYLAAKSYAWFDGWLYLFAGVLTTTAVVATIPLALIPAFDSMGWNLADSLTNQRYVALITLFLITVINIGGVRLATIINNAGVFFEVVGMVVFAIILLVAHHHQSAAVVFHSGGAPVHFSTFFLAAFMSLFVIYGMDTASTLAEETHDPRRKAPRAVISSVVGAFIIGAIFLVAVLVSIPNLASAVKHGLGPAQIILANLPGNLGSAYLMVVSAAVFVCCLVIEAATIRLAFGMSRDRQLPGSAGLKLVSRRLGTPWVASIVVACLAAIPFIQYAGAGFIAIAASGMIYLCYVLANLAVLRARVKGWPQQKAPFKLGRWGIPITVLSLIWGIGMLVNFAWPRVASNPTPDQTNHLLDFKVSWINHIPVLWTVVIGLSIVGAIYYLAVGRRRAVIRHSPGLLAGQDARPATEGSLSLATSPAGIGTPAGGTPAGGPPAGGPPAGEPPILGDGAPEPGS